ncbi:MAG: TonB-dependent receptor plug domain-containing protein [Ignavibacterium sp.]|nr:TonB-dependent receptor plug domain-containing protein [Ignavibacterium sp.]
MFRIILFFFTITSVAVTAQVQDSSSQEIKIYSDSLAYKPDSLFASDSLSTILQRDSIAPIYANALTEKSFIIKNSELLKLEYQYSGDYLRAFPLTFIKDLGFTGQTNETFLYGVGNNAISFLMDGVSYNNRNSNSLNLNLIQSEDVDSIEIIPLPRGFLYSAYNNPVSVNFITKDFIQAQPYTRIRFYQGANRDMMFDGSFNAMVLNKLIASFDVTNRIFDGTYTNSDYSIWQGKIKLKYLLSNDVNIIASYNYNDYNAGYSGGVNLDSVFARVDNVLYDFRSAQMFYPNGELKTLTHLPRLRFLIKPTEWLKTDASLYFLFNRYEKNTVANDYAEDKVYGLNLRNDFDYSVFKFQLNVDYEKRNSFISRTYFSKIDSIYYFNTADSEINLFSVSGIVSANINDSTFIPSVFYKTSSLSRTSNSQWQNTLVEDFSSSGLGVDVLILFKSKLGFYFGSSIFQLSNLSDSKYAQIELGAKYSNEFLSADVKYFINEYSYDFYTGGVFFDYIKYGNLKGLGLNLTFNYWKLFLNSNSSLYSSLSDKVTGVPEFQTQTGLYFKDILFNNNLDLKTGFVFYYTGKNNVFTNENGLLEVPSSNKLDFTLAGEIQKTAIVYFLWQNLLGNDYYITPYYPMPSRSIRFGVAWEMFN